MYSLGIDIGSRNTKIVIWDPRSLQIVWQGYQGTEVSVTSSVDKLLSLSSAHCDVSLISKSCVTSYGRKLYRKADKVLSEISCHAAGCYSLFPDCRTIIDIGGQDSKIITLSDDGKVRDFVMNDKCAAGTGRFLEMTALRLGCPLDELSRLAKNSVQNLGINATCVVYAESEIIGLIAQNTDPASIANAVHESVARRVLTQLSSLDFAPPIVFTGGVAQNSALVESMSRALGEPISVPPDPEITAALGAALLANE